MRRRKNRSNQEGITILAAFIVFLIVGFLIGYNLDYSGETDPTISFAWIDYGPDIMEYPLEKGMVDHRDIGFEYQKVPDEILVQSILDGTYDLGTIPASALPSLYAQGVDDLVIVGGWYKEPVIGNSSVGRLFVKDGSGIRAPKDLKGKRIALDSPGSFNTLMLFEVLERDHDVEMSDLDIIYNDLSQVLLENGEVEGAVVWSSFIWENKGSGEYISLIDYGKEFADLYSTTPPLTLIVARRGFYESSRQDVETALLILDDAYEKGMEDLELIADEYSRMYDVDPRVFISDNMNTRMMFEMDDDEISSLQKMWDLGAEKGYYASAPDVQVFLP